MIKLILLCLMLQLPYLCFSMWQCLKIVARLQYKMRITTNYQHLFVLLLLLLLTKTSCIDEDLRWRLWIKDQNWFLADPMLMLFPISSLTFSPHLKFLPLSLSPHFHPSLTISTLHQLLSLSNSFHLFTYQHKLRSKRNFKHIFCH